MCGRKRATARKALLFCNELLQGTHSGEEHESLALLWLLFATWFPRLTASFPRPRHHLLLLLLLLLLQLQLLLLLLERSSVVRQSTCSIRLQLIWLLILPGCLQLAMLCLQRSYRLLPLL
jgi:hypothetical protein